MHGITDKRVVLGSNKPSEGVATSLRFPSQPGSFSPGNYGSEAGPPDGQPDSPIKTSPVSERIKALEALAAKKKEPDFRSDGGFSHFRDRHHQKSSPMAPKSSSVASKSSSVALKSSTDAPKSSTEAPKPCIEATSSPTGVSKPTEILECPAKITPTVQKRESSSDQESPESPFEVLGDPKQANEFEETEVWMKAHLPPIPDFSAVDLLKGTDSVVSKGKESDVLIPDTPTAFAGVPDAFMDSPVETPELKNEIGDAQKQPSVEEEFDLSFLPTAYMFNQQEKSSVHAPSNSDLDITASPAPPAEFGTLSSPGGIEAEQNFPDDTKNTGDQEPPNGSEVDSSGDSDDTVIEDGIGASAPKCFDSADSYDPNTTPASVTADHPSPVKETSAPRSERKLMQVPTINVIETDEPNYSDDEMGMEPEEGEDYEVVEDSARDAPEASEPKLEGDEHRPPKTRPLETEFMEGYSPPSSPVDSDTEYSPKHKILKSSPEMNDGSTSKSETSADLAECDKTKANLDKLCEVPSHFTAKNEEMDFPNNDDEWSDEVQDILVKPFQTGLTSEESVPYNHSKENEQTLITAKDAYMEMAPLSKTSFMQDDLYDRQSFDYDYDTSAPLDDIDNKGRTTAKERFLSDPFQTQKSQNDDDLEDNQSGDDDYTFPKPVSQPAVGVYPRDPYSCFRSETLSSKGVQEFDKKTTPDSEDHRNLLQKHGSDMEQDATPSTTSNPEIIHHDVTESEPKDSFVEFMRECLKSRQDEEPKNPYEIIASETEPSKTSLPPTMVMDLEQEQLTISALRELGSSQDDDDEVLVETCYSKVSDRDQANLNTTSKQQSSSVIDPNPPCFVCSTGSDSPYSKEVEAIDEWMAEAYHLAEHVLTAVLTHLSGNSSFFWAVGLLIPCSLCSRNPALT
ncbi:uncharacterized protein KZ484_001658 [Pholidichthys leucotaenia]